MLRTEPPVRSLLHETVWLLHPDHPMLDQHRPVLRSMCCGFTSWDWLDDQLARNPRQRPIQPYTTVECVVDVDRVWPMLRDAGFGVPPLFRLAQEVEQAVHDPYATVHKPRALADEFLVRMYGMANLWVALHHALCAECHHLYGPSRHHSLRTRRCRCPGGPTPSSLGMRSLPLRPG
jgi:hypothetical protein